MNYKRHWDYEKDGYVNIYQSCNSACHTMEVDALKLLTGELYQGETGNMEYGIVILSGICNITGDGFAFENIGKRMSVFEGKAYAVYLPKNKKYTIHASTDLKVVIAKCPAKDDFAPVLITPDSIVVKNLGKPGFEREAHFIIDDRTDANRIYIGENFINGGQWSGFPGHKHDTNNMPTEGFAEEVYYYEYDKETGYGVQQVYTADHVVDDTYAVRNGDFVEIPKGYHPCCVAPGYKGYLLWLMSCDNRGFFNTIDAEQAWQL